MSFSQGSPRAQPGWYPDPWVPGGVRWWSGQDWTGFTGPGGGMPPVQPRRPTDGYAIASLITAICGIAPAGIILGFVARGRIRRSHGARDGEGLATAGIVVGGVYLVVIALAVTLALSGVFAEVNSDDYSGEKARVAATIDDFEKAYEDADGVRVCDDLFTSALADSYGGFNACSNVWDADGESGYAEFDVTSLEIVSDRSATIDAHEEGADETWTFTLVRDSGGWRIDGVEW